MQLKLYQEITLLALRDDKGTLSIDHLEQILAGAIIADLILEKRISISADKKRFVDLHDASPSGDPLLDECLQKLCSAKRRARTITWVNRFAAIKRIHHKAAESLCHLGILKAETGKFLILFNRTVYPENNSEPERKIIARLEQAIFTKPDQLSAEDCILVSLAHAAGLLNQTFGRKRLKPYKARIKKISEGELAGEAVRAAIEAIQMTIIIIVSTAAIAAAGS